MGNGANTQESAGSYRQVLAITSFRHLWFGQICSQLAVNSLIFLLALRAYQATGSNTAVSGIFLAYGIPGLLFGMVAGTAVDYLDKRRILIYCDIIRGSCVTLLVLMPGSIAVMYLVTLLNAMVTQFYVPSEAPTIPRLVPDALVVPANSLFSLTFFSSLAAGSVLAGPLLRFLGTQGAFILITALFFAAAWNESKLPSQAKGVYGFSIVLRRNLFHLFARIIQELLDGVRYITKSRVLFDALLLLTGTQIILAMLGTLGPGFADRVLNIDVRDASLLIVGPAVLGILSGALWVGAHAAQWKESQLVKVGVISAGIILLLVSLVVRLNVIPALAWIFIKPVRLGLAFVLFFLLGVANSLLDVPANSILQKEAKGDMRGRVYGMLTAAVGGVGILPVVAGGLLADTLGVGKVIFMLGLTILAYGVWRMKYKPAG